MERKGLLIGAVALLALALGFGIWMQRQEEAAHPVLYGPDGARSGTASAGSVGVDEPSAHVGSRRPPRALDADGGIARAAVPPGLPGGRTREAAPPQAEPQGAEADAQQTTGWRLGQARARIGIVEARVTRMRELVASFEERGETSNAERQRRILARFEARLEELRTEQTDLETQARQDGTMGDADRGFEQTNAAQRNLPPAPVTAP